MRTMRPVSERAYWLHKAQALAFALPIESAILGEMADLVPGRDMVINAIAALEEYGYVYEENGMWHLTKEGLCWICGVSPTNLSA